MKDVFEDHLVWLVTISSSLYSRASKTRYPIEVNVHKDREVVAVNLSTRVVLGRRCLLFFNMNSNQILEFNHWGRVGELAFESLQFPG